jgi:hypothetical protein
LFYKFKVIYGTVCKSIQLYSLSYKNTIIYNSENTFYEFKIVYIYWIYILDNLMLVYT